MKFGPATVMFSAIVLSLANPTTHAATWVEAREMGEGATLPEAGAYAVWAWAEYDGPVSVTIAGETYVLEAPEKAPKGFTWIEAATIEATDTSVSLSATPNVAAVVLSAEEGYSPAQAMTLSRVHDTPEGVTDARTSHERHTDTVFTMPVFEDRRDWEETADTLRRRMLLSSGLYPMPQKTPLNPRVEPATTVDGVVIEKVAFEAWPGFLATGNLYRPDRQGRFPAILSPHGHWENGRLEDGERGSVPKRCIALAQMGAVVFAIDMVGYNDSQQFEHRWSTPEDALWGIHPFGLQLWSSIRAIDFLQSLPYVNAGRIACTGASGGGTQTFALCAVDDRIDVSAPVNMISSTMQGGCVCENAPLIRLDNSNMEIGALMAPKPMMLVSATGDWTRETPRVEYPAIRGIYELYGQADRLDTVLVDAPHNYNQTSREAVYRFFGDHFFGKKDEYASFTEPPIEVPAAETLRVFPDGALPEGAKSSYEVLANLRDRHAERWANELPSASGELATFKQKHGTLPHDVLGVSLPEANDLQPERVRVNNLDNDHAVEGWVVSRAAADDAVPLLYFRKKDVAPQDSVLVVHGEGKAALLDADGTPGALVQGLLDKGKAVIAIDAFLLGEHHSPFTTAKRAFKGGFQDTFHPTITGERVQDVLTALAFIRSRRDLTHTVDLVGLGEAGVWCLIASAADDSVRKTIADVNGFDNKSDEAWVARHYIPCIRAAGGLAAMGALVAPRPLWLMNAKGMFDASGIAQVYGLIPESALRVENGAIDMAEVVAAL